MDEPANNIYVKKARGRRTAMDLEILECDKVKARERYEHYKQALAQTHNDTDRRLAQAYKAVSKGFRLLDVHATIRAAGVGKNNLPRLAIARAVEDFVYYRCESGSGVSAFATGRDKYGYARYQSAYWGVRARLGFPRHHGGDPLYRAQIPIVPPEYRPRYKLSNYHILFEAVWQPSPPLDPILLKHLGGSLYVVLAEWDLTEIERAVMAQAHV